jgi:hypothetical protein
MTPAAATPPTARTPITMPMALPRRTVFGRQGRDLRVVDFIERWFRGIQWLRRYRRGPVEMRRETVSLAA